MGAQPEDEAKYECIVLNNYGQASCEAKCILQSAASLAAAQGEAPGIVEPLKALIVKKGQSAVFKCRFSGNPREYNTCTSCSEYSNREFQTYSCMMRYIFV